MAGAEVEGFRKVVRRVLPVARMLATSQGTFEGTNGVMCATPNDGSVARQVMHAVRFDATLMTIIRINALLDRTPGVVSMQTIWHLVKDEAFSETLVKAVAYDGHASYPNIREREARESLERFQEAYLALDWKRGGAVARLRKLRNKDIAHIDEKTVRHVLTYGEVPKLAHHLVEMASALSFFCDEWPLHPEEIVDTAANTRRVLQGAIV